MRYDPALRPPHPRSGRHLHDRLRNYPEAERRFDRAIQLAPDWAEPYAYKAMLQLVWRGDRERARAVIGQALTRVSAGRLAQALLIPDAISASLLTSDSTFAAAVDAVRPVVLRRRHRPLPSAAWPRRRPIGATGRRSGPTPTRRGCCWSGSSATGPTTPSCWPGPALAYARAGRKAEAIRAGRRAAELLPPSRDANSGPFILTRLAQIYTLVDEPERALESLEPLLSIPSWISPAELRSDPTWAPLRAHPGFAGLAGPA